MRHPAPRPRLHRVSKGVRRRIHTRRSNRVAATGFQSRRADFASAFLARDQSTATDFEHGQTVATGLWPVRTAFGRRDGPQGRGYTTFLRADPRSEIAARLDRAASARGI